MAEATTTHDVIRARRFELVNDEGELRGWMEMTDAGARMVLCDDRGTEVVRVEAQPGYESGRVGAVIVTHSEDPDTYAAIDAQWCVTDESVGTKSERLAS